MRARNIPFCPPKKRPTNINTSVSAVSKNAVLNAFPIVDSILRLIRCGACLSDAGLGWSPSAAASSGAIFWQNSDYKRVIREQSDRSRTPLGPDGRDTRSHTSTGFRASRITLFALRALARAAGFYLTRLWFSRIPAVRFDPVCARLRAGRVPLSGPQVAWKSSFAGSASIAKDEKPALRETRNRTRNLRLLWASRVLRDRRTVAAQLRKRRRKRAALPGRRGSASGISAEGREHRWAGRVRHRGGCRSAAPRRFPLARRHRPLVGRSTCLRRKP